jgi:hypothetical protein
MTREERLIAYVDGELAAAEREAFEAEMAADSGLAAEVARHRRLAEGVGAAFAPVLEEPLPARLLTVAQAANDPGRRARLPLWGAMAASLVAGVLIGKAVWPQEAPSEALTPSSQVAQALTAQLASDPGPVKVGLSFRTADGRYCRTFQSAPDRMAGLACRDEGRWTLRTATAWTPRASADYRTAGSATPPEVLAGVDRLMSGAALDAAQERAARDKGWR